MKNFTLKFALLLILSISFISCAQSTKSETNTAEANKIGSLISPEDLNAKLGEDIQLIDCRTPKEFAEGHLKGAVIIDFYKPDFYTKMAELDKNKTLYIYCRSGNRSGQATKKLETMGFTKIYDLKGGIKNWKRSNLKFVK